MKKVYSTLSKELREEIGRRNISIRKGDEVRVMRGDFRDEEGKIDEIDRSKGKVIVRGVSKEKPDGTKYQIAIHASNLKVVSLSNKEERV